MALVLFFSWRMRLIDGEGQPLLHLDLPALINYWCWLLKEIFVSGIDVCRLILMPDMRLNPRIISFSNDQPSDLTRSILANSITLTPGTVTIDIEDDTTNVHALTDQSADGLLKGAMISRVAALAKIPDKAGE